MLTTRQNQTFRFIRDYVQHYGIAPTMAEIANGIGIKSRGVVHRYVHALADAGLLKILPNRRRNIELVSKTFTRRYLPLVGRIAAGKPIEAILHQETIDLAETFLNDKCFALKVNGNSMIEEGIYDSDIVVCEDSQQANNGQIVVALIDNEEATLKRIHYNPDGSITLIPANSKLAPMLYKADRVTIQGIFIGLLRLAQWQP